MFVIENDALIIRCGQEQIRIEPWGKDALRLRASEADWREGENWGLLDKPECKSEIAIDGETASITNGNITAKVESDYRISFYNGRGELLTREFREVKPFPEIRGRFWQPKLNGHFELTARFEAFEDEMFFGMGEYQMDIINLKGTTLDLSHRCTQASIPFAVSSRGYGFLWNNPGVGEVSFGTNVTKWYLRETEALDYWICAGDTPKEILRKYMDATGKPPMMPDYAFDLVQSKLRYYNQDKLLEVAREYKRRGLKLGTIVIDFIYWSTDGSYQFHKKYWPDPDAMVKELEEMGVKVMISFWPNMGPESPHYKEFTEKGLLIKSNRGSVGAFVDMTNPEARDLVWQKHRPEHFDRGIRNFFIDACEPEHETMMKDNVRYKLGNGDMVSNIYPFYDAKMFWDNMTKEGVTPFNVIRCGWAGSQRFGSMLWSGDIESTFEVLRNQICEGISVGMAGQPWFTTDTAGFYNGNINDPYFRELMCRWFQFSTFSPLLRLHGVRQPDHWTDDGLYSGADNELWSFGDEVYEVLKHYLDVREAIKPYLKQVMQEAHEMGDPAIRGMFYEFPEDEVCYTLKRQYMLGSDMLVAPVMYEGAKTTKVYLPKGESWVDAWTKQEYEGGQWLEKDTPIDVIPVYVRKGSAALDCFKNL